jgi:hypothetical protein
MVSNSKEYQKAYMKNYIKSAGCKICNVCNDGTTYKPYRQYKHNATKKHQSKLGLYYECVIEQLTAIHKELKTKSERRIERAKDLL